jgi:UDP-N-acetylmuramoyl-L-alanyl-D-glutamate--2,6-diaminopimelate ligase
VIIEATSHGLEQGRLAGLKFDTVGYTNITSEHLDYHGNWENYCNAKSLLITDHLKDEGNIILNMDDKSYDVLMKKSIGKNTLSYSTEKVADLFAKDIKEEEKGITFTLLQEDKEYSARLPILGGYNVSNFLCALGVCEKEGLGINSMIKNILSFENIKGRMEILQRNPYTVIVDYAHTPNAEDKALRSARSLIEGEGKLIHVFGCAGRRDFYKRPEMGRISKELADITILTAEDCRMEDLKEINNQIEEGWKEGKNNKAQLFRFDYTDKDVQVRRDAILKSFDLANDGDVIIITGKGHEESLCFGQTEYPWNDIDEVNTLLKSI